MRQWQLWGDGRKSQKSRLGAYPIPQELYFDQAHRRVIKALQYLQLCHPDHLYLLNIGIHMLYSAHSRL